MNATNGQALAGLRQRFEEWRGSRRRGTRIPEKLWQAAVEAAREHGVWQTSRELGVDYYSLKGRLTRPGAPTGPGGMKFVELSGGVLSAGSPACVVELQDRKGLRLRVELRDAAGTESLARSLWRSRR